VKLDAKDIVVRFGGVVAVNSASVSIEGGTIRAVIGPNGSGKTTLFNAITGLAPLTGEQPLHQRVRQRVSRTFQTPRFDPTMTLGEAVLCGFYPLRKSGFFAALSGMPASVREARHFRQKCDALLDSFRILQLAKTPMGELSMGLIRLVDVARAMAADPAFLLLDEPAAGLSSGEQATLMTEIRRVAAHGVGVLLIEHNFEMVTGLAEHLTVLERGSVLIRGTPEVVSADEGFRAAYLGSEVGQ
jgi:branched-chain amino acid transport system ATP-binding protein